MGGGLESRCVSCVYGADGAVRVARHHPHHLSQVLIGFVINTYSQDFRDTVKDAFIPLKPNNKQVKEIYHS